VHHYPSLLGLAAGDLPATIGCPRRLLKYTGDVKDIMEAVLLK
jgi:hypothetical protein